MSFRRVLTAFSVSVGIALAPPLAADPQLAEESGIERPSSRVAPETPAVARGVTFPPVIVLMPDSTNNRLVAFNAADGSVVDANLFALAEGTPIHAIKIGGEIWVSEQIGDRISRWLFDGTPIGAVGASGGLDNIRGMALLPDGVLVTNAGTANGAPGAGIVRVGLNGNILGSVATSATSSSPFAILLRATDRLVASSAANDDVHRYDTALATLGTFHNSTTLNFAQQMDVALNGEILVAGFGSNNIVRLNAATGDVISSIPAAGARGVLQLANGNILWSSAAGAFVYDVSTQTSAQVYTGGGRHLSRMSTLTEVIFANGFEEPVQIRSRAH